MIRGRTVGVRQTGLSIGVVLLVIFCLPEYSPGQSLEETKRLEYQVVELYKQGRYQKAIPFAKRALAIDEKALGPEHPAVANSLNNLALLYDALGDYSKAKPLYKRALAIYEKTLSPEHPEVAKSLNNLAELYRALGDYSKAEPLYKRALAINEKALGPEHPHVAISLNNLAGLYHDLGDYSKAEPLYKRALKIWEKALGSEHPHVAISLNNLAGLYHDLGDYSKAEPLLKRALAIREKAFRPDHPNVATSLNNLAALYDALGDYSKAEPLYKRALAIREKALGPEHTEVAESLNNLAGLYLDLGDYTNAEPLYKRALAINEKALGPDHPNVATSLMNLASLKYALGDYTNAETLHKRSLAIYEKALGPDHPNVAVNLNYLAGLYKAIGDFTSAEPLCKRALASLEKALGPDHPDIATSLNNLAALYSDLGDYSKAEPLFKRALAVREKILGPNHPDVATSLNGLALMYDHLGDYTNAKPLYIRALAISEKALGPDHPDVAASLNNLAALYSALGDYSKAEPLYNRALAIYEKTLSPDHQYVTIVNEHLSSLYLLEGRIDEAFKWFKRKDVPQGLGKCYLVRREYKKALKEYQRSLNRTSKLTQNRFIIVDHIGLALSYEGLGAYARARKSFKNAIDIIEVQWYTLSLSARKTFMAGRVGANFTRLDAYEGMVRVIIKEKKSRYQKEALLYAESVKSRTFLEILAAKGAKGTGKTDQEILKKDRRFQMDITVKKKRIAKLEELGAKAPKGDKEQVEKELNKILQDYEQFINEVKLQDTELASLVTVQTTPVEKIQALLDPSTTLLEYFTTKDKTYAWLITTNDITVQELNIGNKKLLAMVNDLLLPNISNNIRRREEVVTIPTGGIQDKTSDNKERNRNREQFIKGTREFYNSIFRPVENKIHTKGLIVVPHGVLHKVPFAALSDGEKLMVDKYAISTVPSSTTIQYIVGKRSKNNGQFLAFANPAVEYVLAPFLKNAENEVENIKKLFQKKMVHIRKDATETRAKQESDSPDVIHFACHGEFNDKQPMQSGLLLAKSEDNDGILQVHELFGLNLKNVNLIVLSACDTALSKIQGGDDLVGLSRGFIYAGTPSLMATLWQVDDRSTSMLMERFYENWLQKGLSKPEALRQAQLSIKSMPGYEHPYYWAPFIIIGDWM